MTLPRLFSYSFLSFFRTESDKKMQNGRRHFGNRPGYTTYARTVLGQQISVVAADFCDAVLTAQILCSSMYVNIVVTLRGCISETKTVIKAKSTYTVSKLKLVRFNFFSNEIIYP